MEFSRKSTFRNALSALISNGEDRSKDNRKRYKSEYKKKFRPFSQYVYEASKGTFTKCRGKGKSNEEASERMLGDAGQGVAGASTGTGGAAGAVEAGEDSANTLRAAGLQPLGLAQGDSWYREVLDLRKRAGEYKVCGHYILLTTLRVGPDKQNNLRLGKRIERTEYREVLYRNGICGLDLLRVKRTYTQTPVVTGDSMEILV